MNGYNMYNKRIIEMWTGSLSIPSSSCWKGGGLGHYHHWEGDGQEKSESLLYHHVKDSRTVCVCDSSAGLLLCACIRTFVAWAFSFLFSELDCAVRIPLFDSLVQPRPAIKVRLIAQRMSHTRSPAYLSHVSPRCSSRSRPGGSRNYCTSRA